MAGSDGFAMVAAALDMARNGAGAAPPVSELIVDMADALQRADEPLESIIYPVAVPGYVTVLAGKHSSFKSWLMMAGSHGAHAGRAEVAGMPVSPGRALYVDAENGPKLMARRFRAAGMPSGAFVVANGFPLRLPEHAAVLRALIEHTSARLITLDSLRRLAPGARENDSDDMAPIFAALGQIARDLDVAIVIIHHRSSKFGAADTRGSSAIEDQADAVFVLERVTRDPERNRRRLRTVKFRMDEEPPARWLQLGHAGEYVTIDAAPAYEEGEDSEPEHERLAVHARAFADVIAVDGGWQPNRLAGALGVERDSGSFQRMMDLLEQEGWTRAGKGKATRIQPCQPDPPIGVGTVGTVRDEDGAA